MRLTIGSEELLKNSARTFMSQSMSTPGNKEKPGLENLSAVEFRNASSSKEGNTLFTRHPFRDFTDDKLNNLLQKENLENLLKMREKALKGRVKAER